MSSERLDVAFYDSGANIPFANALVDTVVIPAYFAALDKDTEEEHAGGNIIADTEVWYEGNRVQYEFLAQPDEQTICIISTAHSFLNDLSDAGAQLIHDDLQASNIMDDVKGRYADTPALLQRDATVETFVRRSFYVRLIDDINEVRVETQLGYSVNGHEVARGLFYENGEVESELDRATVFEVDEILEIIRGLLALDFIKEEDVKHFLNQKF